MRQWGLQFRKDGTGGGRFNVAWTRIALHDPAMPHRTGLKNRDFARPSRRARPAVSWGLSWGLGVGLATGAMAAAGTASAATTGTLSATYDGYAHGVIALRLTASFDFTPGAYSGRLEFHTAGMLGWMVHTESDSQVEGRFAPSPTLAVLPAKYDSTGVMHGTDRITRITYQNGTPMLQTVVPPVAQERVPVPAAETQHTIDTLSAIALLMRQVGQSGTCDGAVNTFDGRRLTAMTAHTVGPESLSPNRKLGFDGHALRCDFTGVQLAGFMKGRDEAQLRRPRHGSAWVAPLVPGAPPLPVKVVFENDALGVVTLYLTSVSGSSGAVAQNK